MPRTEVIQPDEYDEIISDILDEYYATLVNKQPPQIDWEMLLQDILNDEWAEDTFEPYTYESIATCAYNSLVNSSGLPKDHLVNWQEGPQQAFDTIAYQYVRENLRERTMPPKKCAMLLLVHRTFHDFLANRTYESPQELIQEFNLWFSHERTHGSTPAADIDPIPTGNVTPDHITGREILDVENTSVLRAFLWWFDDEHPNWTDTIPTT